MLVLDLHDADGLARAELAPEILRHAVAVVRDDGVRGLQDAVGRAVVLLEREDLSASEVLLELEDVADVGAAERIDGLVGIADDADVAVLAAEELKQPVLRVVRILVLVDEDVAERLLPAFPSLGEPLEHLDGQHEQVVEVDRVRRSEALLVLAVDLGDGLLVEGGDPLRVLAGPDQGVLRVRDLCVDAARREALRILVEALETLLREANLVGLVVDREARLVAQTRRFLAEDPAAGGMEGQHPHRPYDAAEQIAEPRAHLVRRLVRERDRENLRGLDAAREDEMRDPVGEHARLAGAGPGDDQHRALGREHCVALGRIQLRQVLLRGENGHPAMVTACLGRQRYVALARRTRLRSLAPPAS